MLSFPYHIEQEHTPLNCIPLKSLLIIAILTLSACVPGSVNTAIKNGAKPLNAAGIYNLVNANTIRLISADFDADLFLFDNGKLSAKGLFYDTRDTGIWDIKSSNRICIRFATWYYNDENCYSIYKEAGAKESYLLFTENGAAAYTMTVASGNINNLKMKGDKNEGVSYVRSDIKRQGGDVSYTPSAPASAPTPAPAVLAAPAPSAPDAEISHTVKLMALDCPGCNLQRADLRQADLVGANLQGANLSGADLSRANLRRANLEGADLSGATLLSANLPGANLKDADLTGADLTGANLIHADLTGADLDNALLENTLNEGTKGL